ncbi:MAG: creatininase family protein [Patescibacteria group bacterium]
MDHSQSIFVEDSTWAEVEAFLKAQCKNAIAVWGWGATEQHGPRMIEGTDTLIADHFMRVIADNRPVIVFPTMPIGMSRHHEAFAGTMSLSAEAATSVACCVLRSIYRTGIRKLFALMGHGGNVAPFNGAITSLGKEIAGLKITEHLDGLFYETEGELGDLINNHFGEKPSHAGALEASVLYAILDQMKLGSEVSRLMNIPFTDGMVTPGIHGQGTQGSDPIAFQRMFPTGSKGDQRKADLDFGIRILDLMSDRLLAYFDEFSKS